MATTIGSPRYWQYLQKKLQQISLPMNAALTIPMQMLHLLFIQYCSNEPYVTYLRMDYAFRWLKFQAHKSWYVHDFVLSWQLINVSIKFLTSAFSCDPDKIKEALVQGLNWPAVRRRHPASDADSEHAFVAWIRRRAEKTCLRYKQKFSIIQFNNTALQSLARWLIHSFHIMTANCTKSKASLKKCAFRSSANLS
jgi:hypothetical protein